MRDSHLFPFLFPLTLPCWSKPGGSSDRAPREQIVCMVCPVVGWVGQTQCSWLASQAWRVLPAATSACTRRRVKPALRNLNTKETIDEMAV